MAPGTPAVISLPGLSPFLLEALGRAAAGDRLALVGGAVRDLLLHRLHNDPWRGVPDLDLVVEAGPAASRDAAGPALDALPPAHRLARALPAILGPEMVAAVQEHGAYGTVELELRLATGPLLLDVASARRETYPVPGENPRVCEGSLLDDLARRDFTINAMALVLHPMADDGPTARAPGEPELLDPFGGRADLGRRQLRFLHPASVRDDPTRLVRGARYVSRLGFTMAPESLAQLRGTLAAWPWPWRPGDLPALAPPALGTRLRMELDLLLEREAWPTALAALQEWGALSLLDGALQQDHQWRRRLHWAARAGLPLMPALLFGAGKPLELAERLQIPHRQHRLLAQALAVGQCLATLPADQLKDRSPSQWTALLEGRGWGHQAVALALAASWGPRRPLLRWWLRWRHLGSPVSPAALLATGMKPGVALGERLRLLRAERLDQERL